MGHTQSLFEETIGIILDPLTIKLLSEPHTQEAPDSLIDKTALRFKDFLQRNIERTDFHLLRRNTFRRIIRELQWSKRLFNLPFYHLVRENYNDFDRVYDWLCDEYSKSVFDWFVKIHLGGLFLGGVAPVLFPLIVKDTVISERAPVIKKRGLFRDQYTVNGNRLGCPVHIIKEVFLNREYAYRDILKPLTGDIVVEGGGFFGETALWFSEAVGPTGHVWSFEPEKHNYRVLTRNMSVNRLTNVTPVLKGLWESEGQVGFQYSTSSSRVVESDPVTTVPMTTLDAFVNQRGLERVDFIKLDIEGSERQALRGMQNTIRRFHPKLAICVYHLYDDIVVIPKFVKELYPGYEIYLDHFSEGLCETVMFFQP